MKTKKHLHNIRRFSAFAAILLASIPSLCHGAELGGFAYVFGWENTPNNFGTYTKGGTGIVSQGAAESYYKSNGTASFHALSGTCSAIGGTNPGRSAFAQTGGSAYFFDQITISSPTVADGTIGTADFMLLLNGSFDAGPSHPDQSTSFNASVSYSWAGVIVGEGGDGQPDINIGERFSQSKTVFSSYSETTGTSFLNQPRNHQLIFKFGVPFDFTVVVQSSARVVYNTPCTANSEIRLTGWNGFNNIQVRFGDPVADANFASQTGFNYGGPGSISFEQWASQFQLAPAAFNEDSNNNGMSNLLEYALGRNPVAPAGADPFSVMRVTDSGITYPALTFTRPALGARPADITYTPEKSTTLATNGWGVNGLETEVVPGAGQTETVIVRSTQPLGSLPGEFMRLKVSPPPAP